MNRHALLGYGPILAGLALLLFVGCASPLDALDYAAAQGLVRWEPVRPYARINDGAPWSRTRGVEVTR